MTGRKKAAPVAPLAEILRDAEDAGSAFGGIRWDPAAMVASVMCDTCGWSVAMGTNIGWLVEVAWFRHLRDAHGWRSALEFWILAQGGTPR